MEKVIHILHLEDDARDAELVQALLESTDLACRIGVVQTRDQFTETLQAQAYDIILADYRLPSFDGVSALRWVREHCPDVPFIFVSGVMGEDAAIEGLTEGATDYVLKQRLSRLVPAVRRALREAANRRERRRAEESLRHAHEYLSQLISSANVMIIGVDTHGRIKVFNEAAERVTGYAIKDLEGVNWFDRIVPRDRYPHVWEVFQRHQQGTDALPPILENPILTKAGEERFVSWQNSMVTAPEAEISTISFGIDITERKGMEKALRELNAKLEGKVAQRTAELQKRARQLQQLTLQLSLAEERERERIGAFLHEDLQQQIAGVKFHLNLLRSRTRHDRESSDLLTRVDEMLREAIEESRNLSHELSPAVLSQNDFAETIRWLADHVYARQGLRVHVSVRDEMTLRSSAVTIFLFRAVQEILSNVVKHAGVREAAIRMSYHRRCVCVAISDRGKGFNPESLEETTGFGLLSIRERAELLGGRTRIKSRPNAGTTFSVVVPDGTGWDPVQPALDPRVSCRSETGPGGLSDRPASPARESDISL